MMFTEFVIIIYISLINLPEGKWPRCQFLLSYKIVLRDYFASDDPAVTP